MTSKKKLINKPELFDKWIFNSQRDVSDSAVLTDDSPSLDNPFRVGMKLEAVDRKFPSLFCVATVIRVVGDELLIYFDGWAHTYDYWCRYTTPEIRPIGTCKEIGQSLQSPNSLGGARDNWGQGWTDYLRNTGAPTLPSEKFFPLYLSETGENLFSLFELIARLLLTDETVDISSLPMMIQIRLQEAGMCSMCGTKFLMGWKAVRVFCSQEKLSKEGCRILCSQTCAVHFSKKMDKIKYLF